MRIAILDLHEGLSETSRLRALISRQEKGKIAELGFLVGCGFLAAVLSGYLDLRLRIPGHAILRSVFPMALGLAVVPRRGAGTIMGVSALLSGFVMRVIMPVDGLGLGALTSLTLTGPLLDLSLGRARVGWQLYAGFAVAGLAANAVALVVRGGAKYIGVEHIGARPFSEWLLQASVSYLICGSLAGLVSGVVWFQATRPRGPNRQQGHAPTKS